MFTHFVKALLLSLVCLMFSAPALAVSPPTVSPVSQSSTSSVFVTMNGGGFPVYFSTDGSLPSPGAPGSTLYIGDIGGFSLFAPTTINAIAYDSSTQTSSSVTTRAYDVDANVSPLLVSGLQLRLRAGLGIASAVGNPKPVLFWADISSNGKDASGTGASAPVLLTAAGMATSAVAFSGNQYLTLPSGFSTFSAGATVIAVQSADSLIDAPILDIGRGASGDDIVLKVSSSGNQQLGIFAGNTGSFATSAGVLPKGALQLVEAVFTSGTPNGSALVSVSGVAGSPNGSMQNLASVTRSLNFLGQPSAGLGARFHGKLVELLLYNRPLSASELTSIRLYLSRFYNLANQPAASPTFFPPSGTLTKPSQIVIGPARGCSVIRYTSDDSPVTADSPIFAGPIWINHSQKIRAVNFTDGFPSAETSATYLLDPVLYPTPSRTDASAPTITIDLPTATQ